MGEFHPNQAFFARALAKPTQAAHTALPKGNKRPPKLSAPVLWAVYVDGVYPPLVQVDNENYVVAEA